LPEPTIANIAFYNKEVVYGILFHATAQTLLTTAAERLGVELGFFCVLHSWGHPAVSDPQPGNLHFHPHLRCVVPGGGLSPDHQGWIAARRRFLLPVKVLSRRFRRLVLKALAKARVGGLRQASLRGTGSRAGVSRPLYAPRRPDVMAGVISTRNHPDFSSHPRNSSASGCLSPSRIAPTTAQPALPAAATPHSDRKQNPLKSRPQAAV
jgi:hypothetical protein